MHCSGLQACQLQQCIQGVSNECIWATGGEPLTERPCPAGVRLGTTFCSGRAASPQANMLPWVLFTAVLHIKHAHAESQVKGLLA